MKLRRTIGILTALLLLLSLFPAAPTAFALGAERTLRGPEPGRDLVSVIYTDPMGLNHRADCTVVTPELNAWADGWYAVTEDVTVESRITVSGSVNLILCDGAELTAAKGVSVNEWNDLTIWEQENGTGALTATAQKDYAGIGGDNGKTCGTVTINGGVVSATTGAGTSSAAGIGGGRSGAGGTVVINGGNVTAVGQGWSAGIGGGGGSGSSGSTTNGGAGGTVLIRRGVVNVTSGYRGAGIGGANGSGGGTVEILDATVNITVAGGGQPIGGGERALNAPGTLTLGYLRVTSPENTTAEDRVAACRVGGADVTLEPCVDHEGDEDAVCIWCGLQGTPYVNAQGEGRTIFESIELDSYTMSFDDGWYILDEDLYIGSRVDVFGDVNLLLCDGCTLTAPDGVHVSEGASFTVWGQAGGTGELICEVQTEGLAGIGGNCADRYGEITVNGGRITASGGESAAGIGGGFGIDPVTQELVFCEGGPITINGGTVSAVGGIGAAGIGGGVYNSAEVVINGGAVTASGNEYGTGIGGGACGEATVTINGGTIAASGGVYFPGIGSGYAEAEYSSNCTVSISGGTVTATGGKYAPGIGSGFGQRGDITSSCTVSISGGTVTAVGDEGAAGVGSAVFGEAEVLISGGEITATGGLYGAGVGFGYVGHGSVTVTGGTVTATGGQNGAGLGSSRKYEHYEGEQTGTVTVTGGTVTAVGGQGAAGVGGGYQNICAVSITGGTVTATGGAAIEEGGEDGCAVGSGADTADASEVSIGPGLTVYAGPDAEAASIALYWDRVFLCERNYYVEIGPCGEHLFGDNGLCQYCGLAGGAVPYVDAEGNAMTPIATWALPDAGLWSDGWYVVAENLTLNDRVEVSGEVNLILCDGCTLTAPDGVHVPEGASFTVWGQAGGTGELICEVETFYQAGIGGNAGENFGEITLNGGTVTAVGGYYGAGIGSSLGYDFVTNEYVLCTGGPVTVNGGTVTAVGGSNASGIGCGFYGNVTVTVNGGMVSAAGGNNAAGIGSGFGARDCCSNCTVSIYGGRVMAVGSSYCAGIGSCQFNNSTILISGGEIIASGGYAAAGVGSGYGGSSTVRILGGVVTAYGGEQGAGLGSGALFELDSLSSEIPPSSVTVEGGTVTAVGGLGAAGVGGGYKNTCAVSVTGGMVTATGGAAIEEGGEDACAVGSGADTAQGSEVSIGPGLTVSAGSDPETAEKVFCADRVPACAENRCAEIGPCGLHIYVNGVCQFCGEEASPMPYVDAEGCDMPPAETWNSIISASWSETWYVVTDDTTLEDRVEVTGDVNLILCDGAVLTAEKGVHVPEGASLTVWGQSAGTGALNCGQPEASQAGVGGDSYESSGQITLNGGSVTALGGREAAGIGGGRYGNGTVTVNGGFVSASGNYGAGLGGGYGGDGFITVNGGTVTAAGGYWGAGLGGGCQGDGIVTVAGGTVAAAGGYAAPGLGGGRYGTGEIAVTGGVVTGVGGSRGAAFGGETLSLAEGLRVTAGSGESAAEPALQADRVDACTGEPWARVAPCEPHCYEEGVCCYCGSTDPGDLPFTDVPDHAWYRDAVRWAYYYEPQITSGTSETTFSPEAACTRAQVLTFLWRAEGSPEPDSPVSSFTDVQNPSAWYYKAVLWAKENGITTGVSENLFGVGQPCTRAQVVTFLWRASNSPDPVSAANPFVDVQNQSFWYYRSVLWAYQTGITAGTDARHFSPSQTCTRAQVVTFLWAAYGPES